MILADTSVWIEFLRGSARYRSIFGGLIEERRVCAIECVFAELLQGVKNEREAAIVKEYWHDLRQIDSAGLWIAAGYLCYREKFASKGIGIVDAALIVAAKREKLRIWTLDRKLSGVLPSSMVFDPGLP